MNLTQRAQIGSAGVTPALGSAGILPAGIANLYDGTRAGLRPAPTGFESNLRGDYGISIAA